MSHNPPLEVTYGNAARGPAVVARFLEDDPRVVPVLSLGSVLNADDLARWLTSYLKRGVIFEATARVREQSYGSRNAPSIHVRVGPTGWDLLIEPDLDSDYAWHTVMETSDVDVTLTTSDMATLMQSMRTIYEMCTELENLSYATRIPHRQSPQPEADQGGERPVHWQGRGAGVVSDLNDTYLL